MKLSPHVSDARLSDLGAEAVGLLVAGRYQDLATRFGYALSYDRDPAAAIRADVQLCLGELGAKSLVGPPPQAAKAVKHFPPNDNGLHSVIELETFTDTGAKVLVELVVTGQKGDRYLTLEDVSVVA